MKPMLAVAIEDVNLLTYPCYISGKLDGVRVLKLNGKVVTRSLKPLPNKHVRDWLERVLPDGADGEVLSPSNNFAETSGNVRRESGKPEMHFYWFDWIKPGVPFLERQEAMRAHHATLNDPNVIFWESIPCANVEALLEAEAKILAAGLEGVMVRQGDAPYKHGRSTLREGYLLKLKRFEDSEARVVGLQELLRNGNEAVTNLLGRTERSSVKSGLTAGGTLGALIVQDLETGIQFGIGTGFSQAQRDAIWAERDTWEGRIVKYRHQPVGKKDAPRFPSYLGERMPEDMS